MASFTPWPLYSREKRQQYPLTSEEGCVPKLSGRLADEKHLPLPATERLWLGCPSRTLDTTSTELTRFRGLITLEIIETRPGVGAFHSSDGHTSFPHYEVILCTF
jgi:hypothetical protein